VKVIPLTYDAKNGRSQIDFKTD